MNYVFGVYISSPYNNILFSCLDMLLSNDCMSSYSLPDILTNRNVLELYFNMLCISLLQLVVVVTNTFQYCCCFCCSWHYVTMQTMTSLAGRHVTYRHLSRHSSRYQSRSRGWLPLPWRRLLSWWCFTSSCGCILNHHHHHHHHGWQPPPVNCTVDTTTGKYARIYNNNNNNNNNPLYSFADKPLRYASQQLTRRTALDKPWHAGQVQPTTGLSTGISCQHKRR